MNHLFHTSPVSSSLQVSVVIPAKDEAKHLPATLRALTAQTGLGGVPLSPDSWEVLLLINNSTDDSLAIARRFQQGHPEMPLQIVECCLPPEFAHVGHARRLLMDAACARLERQPKTTSLIISTDADTEVTHDWVAQNLAEMSKGAEAVGGRIVLRDEDLQCLDEQTRAVHVLDDRYRVLVAWLEDQCDPQAHDPWPRHHQHFGGSFAVTPRAYRQVGGLPAKESLEDVALYQALLRQDVKFRHSPKVCVQTSGRLEGRTSVGLAEQLSRWDKDPEKITVPSVLFWRTFFSTRRQLRKQWERDGNGRPFGAAFEELKLEEKLGSQLRPQLLTEAARELETLFRGTRFSDPVFSVRAVPDDIGALGRM